ncbi:MAG: MarR family transcriptional regulator [Candidatus Omnitrophica bacterium]|nr:MarR family transcriptional regulator [Candidatus Omnitrophota bacterium]
MKPTAARQTIFQEMGFSPNRAWLGGAVAYSVARTYNLLMRRLAHLYARHGLTPSSFNLLMLLKHGVDPDEMTQRTIGERLVVSASDMTGLIDRLERRGLARRTPAGRDRRKKLLRITPQGSKLLEAVWPHHVEAITALCQVLSEDEAERLVTMMGKLRTQCA